LIKFDVFLERARRLGATRIATGHYARIVEGADGWELHQAADLDKDQSYFLFELSQEQLSRSVFPLGEMHKAEVRAEAKRLGLCVADKGESMDLCFIDSTVSSFVEERLEQRGVSGSPSTVVDREGRPLGSAGPTHGYTVGQRHGLGISSKRKLYVIRLDPGSRRVIVGNVSDLDCTGARVAGMNWISGRAPRDSMRLRVQVRHRHAAVLAKVDAIGEDAASVRFDEPVRAVAPGQAAVFYDADSDEEVIGGGWIVEGIR